MIFAAVLLFVVCALSAEEATDAVHSVQLPYKVRSGKSRRLQHKLISGRERNPEPLKVELIPHEDPAIAERQVQLHMQAKRAQEQRTGRYLPFHVRGKSHLRGGEAQKKAQKTD